MRIHLDVCNLSIKKCIGFMLVELGFKCNLSIKGVPEIVEYFEENWEHLD